MKTAFNSLEWYDIELTIVLPQRYLTQKSQCVAVLNLWFFLCTFRADLFERDRAETEKGRYCHLETISLFSV